MKRIILLIALTLVGVIGVYGAISCPTPIWTADIGYAANYGAYDGANFWFGGYETASLYKMNSAGTMTDTYTGACPGANCVGRIVQVAYDGQYIWTAGGELMPVVRFNVTTTARTQFDLSSASIGSGGVQGVIWDGANIWFGIAQAGGGAGSGLVCKWEQPGNYISITVTGQTNVNGLAYGTYAGQKYIIAACNGFWSKINATNGVVSSYTTIGSTTGYRIATDNVYVYVALYGEGQIKKYNLSDGTLVATWNSGTLLNTIMFDGIYIWVAGDDGVVTIHDRNTGTIVCELADSGVSDLVFDGYSVWSIIKNTSGGNGKVLKISNRRILTPYTPTATNTPTTYQTRTITPTKTMTFTKTVTRTMTQTHTLTPTRTITQTNTAYPSQTITQTYATPTNTNTITQTYTTFPTASITPTFSHTKTITQTRTITQTHTVTPTSTTIPSTVTLSYIASDNLNYQTEMEVGWDMIGSSYVITVSNTAKVLYNSDNISDFPDQYFVYRVKHMAYDKTYPVRVTAFAVDGVGRPSNVIYISPKATPTP